MSDDTPLRIEVFQVGTHRGDNGKTYSYPPDKVDQAIANFDPTKFRPPLIVTPAMNHDHRPYGDRDLATSPLAHGVPSKLERIGDRVFAEFEKHTPHFAEWLKQGRIPGISAAFYGEDDPRNPNPGEATFRHFAGVLFPSVKGMELPGFSELISAGAEPLTDETIVSFGEAEFTIVLDSLYRLRDWLVETKGREEAEAVLPAQELRDALSYMQTEERSKRAVLDEIFGVVSDLSQRLQRLEQMELTEEEEDPEFTEAVTPSEDLTVPKPEPETSIEIAAFAEEKRQLEAEMEALRSANAKLLDQLDKIKAEQTRAEIAAFCEPLPEDLKSPISFGETDVSLSQFAESLPESGREFLKLWLPKIKALLDSASPTTPAPAINPVFFSEVSSEATESLTSDDASNFSEYDPESIAYERRVRAYALEHNVGYTIAAQAVRGY